MIYLCSRPYGSRRPGSLIMNCFQFKAELDHKGMSCKIIDNLISISNVKNSAIFFFKDSINLGPYLAKHTILIKKLKNNGNKFIFMTIDITLQTELYSKATHPFYKIFDYIITPSIYFKNRNPMPKVIYIPHHYDRALLNVTPATRRINKILYSGGMYNFVNSKGVANTKKYTSTITFVNDFRELVKNINLYKEYKYHISFYGHQTLKFKLKPATKISTAAAMEAVILCVKSEETVHWLGEEYPFYLDGTEKNLDAMIQNIYSGKISDEMYDKGLAIIRKIKQLLSLPYIVDNHYKPLFDENGVIY